MSDPTPFFDHNYRASDALAEARHDAALYGRERRERIRRYLRSLEVEKEYERMEQAAAATEPDDQADSEPHGETLEGLMGR